MRVQFIGRGHPNIRATHAKTLEITADDTVSVRGTCIVGVAAELPPSELLRLRGEVAVGIECSGFTESLVATITPFYLGEPDLVIRRGPPLRQRTFAACASKAAADLSQDMVSALRLGEPLRVSIDEIDRNHAAGALFVVALPIGNDEDISTRAKKVLAAADLVVAEDTRRYRRTAGAISAPIPDLISHHVGNESRGSSAILERLTHGDRIVLVTDAGTPTVSDPGYLLIDAAMAEGHDVCVVPGPSAAIAAIVASGLQSDRFHFIGFFPRRSADRRRCLAELDRSTTTVAFESPHRINDALRDIEEILDDPVVAVCRELTKLHEAVIRAHTSEIIAKADGLGIGRGEHTIVIGPFERPQAAADDDTLYRVLAALGDAGVGTKVLADAVAKATGGSRRHVYDRLLRSKSGDAPA